MKRIVSCVLLAGAVIFAGVAKAAPDFDFYNNLPISVCYLYISPNNSSDWEEDILGPCIGPYERVRIVIKSGNISQGWDIRWTDENGGEGSFFNVNLNNYGLVYLDSDRNLLFE